MSQDTTTTKRTMTDAECLEDLMNQWDASRARWIARFGSDAGFGDWFRGQLDEHMTA